MGAGIMGVFQWGMRYAKYATLATIAFAIGVFRRIRRARYVALVVIGFALAMYAAPYLVDALQCAGESTADQVLECLGETYDRARQDTNLAAITITIALAVTLAAWQPERPRRRQRANAHVRIRRRRLRNANASR